MVIYGMFGYFRNLLSFPQGLMVCLVILGIC